jgi:hypothetical protein
VKFGRRYLIALAAGIWRSAKNSAPGPLYGVSGDIWAALALVITWWDQNQPAPMEVA